jgi:hypothetical protein
VVSEQHLVNQCPFNISFASSLISMSIEELLSNNKDASLVLYGFVERLEMMFCWAGILFKFCNLLL